MEIMINILINNIFPILVLAGLGFLLGKKFNLDIGTLNKVNFYALIPSFTFAYLYATPIPLDMLKVLAAVLILIAVNYTAAITISRIRNYNPGIKNAFINSIMFYNSGNIGVPLITLIFSSAPFIEDGKTPYLSVALSAQIMVLVVQNISANTIGFYNAGRARSNWRKSLGKVFKMPAVYAVPTALLLKLIPFDFTRIPLWPSVTYLRNAMVPMALLILGIQMSQTRFHSIKSTVALSVLFRLLAGPLIATGIIYLLSLHGVIAQTVLISSSLPTAVNTALIAVECDNQPDFASQIVLLSTLGCIITLSVVIYLAHMMFPV